MTSLLLLLYLSIDIVVQRNKKVSSYCLKGLMADFLVELRGFEPMAIEVARNLQLRLSSPINARAAYDFRSRWGRSRTNDEALRGRVAREILMDKGDRDTALANGGRDALHRAKPNGPAGEHARNAGLDKIWVAACRSARLASSEPEIPLGNPK
jgi:hypothetical protein